MAQETLVAMDVVDALRTVFLLTAAGVGTLSG
jgi:hypothetical protein